jgi:hypothetical protein
LGCACPIIHVKRNKDGSEEEIVEDEGVPDKRLLAIEEEFSAVLKVAARERNTISDVLRRAWDHGDLRTMTKNSPARATGAHVTVIGHITKPDLGRLLSETDALNGFGNRFIWLAVRRSKLLPDGGALHTEDLARLTLRLQQALDSARKAALIKRSEAAGKLWHERYPVLTADRHGVFRRTHEPCRAQVMRLALIYALLDCSPQIDIPHLEAALAFWDFVVAPPGSSLAKPWATAWRIASWTNSAVLVRVVDENQLRNCSRNLTSDKIRAALGLLLRLRLAHWLEGATTPWRWAPSHRVAGHA